MTEQNKQHFWDIREENGLLHLLDPDKHMYAYVKWDGEIHMWYYDDSQMSFDHDTGLKDYTQYGFEGKSHHDYYDMFDIDEQIARLQSLREIAAKWFAEHGKRWPPDWKNYEQGKIDIEQAQELPNYRDRLSNLRARIATLGIYTEAYGFAGPNDSLIQFAVWTSTQQDHQHFHVIVPPDFLETKSDEELHNYLQSLITIMEDRTSKP